MVAQLPGSEEPATPTGSACRELGGLHSRSAVTTVGHGARCLTRAGTGAATPWDELIYLSQCIEPRISRRISPYSRRLTLLLINCRASSNTSGK
jgi:hypothetical protein